MHHESKEYLGLDYSDGVSKSLPLDAVAQPGAVDSLFPPDKAVYRNMPLNLTAGGAVAPPAVAMYRGTSTGGCSVLPGMEDLSMDYDSAMPFDYRGEEVRRDLVDVGIALDSPMTRELEFADFHQSANVRRVPKVNRPADFQSKPCTSQLPLPEVGSSAPAWATPLALDATDAQVIQPSGAPRLQHPVPTRAGVDPALAAFLDVDLPDFTTAPLDGDFAVANKRGSTLSPAAAAPLPVEQMLKPCASPCVEVMLTGSRVPSALNEGEQAGDGDVARDVCHVLHQFESTDAALRLSKESFSDGADDACAANGLRQRRGCSYEATIDTLCEMQHLRVCVEVSPRHGEDTSADSSSTSQDGSSSNTSPVPSDAGSVIQSRRVFGCANAFELFNDRLAQALRDRAGTPASNFVQRAEQQRKSGAASAPPTIRATGGMATGGMADHLPNGPEGVARLANLRRLVQVARLADGDSVEALANEPAAEAAARSLCKLMYKPCEAQAVLGDAALRDSVLGLLGSECPGVFRYAVVTLALLIQHGNTHTKCATPTDADEGVTVASLLRSRPSKWVANVRSRLGEAAAAAPGARTMSPTANLAPPNNAPSWQVDLAELTIDDCRPAALCGAGSCAVEELLTTEIAFHAKSLQRALEGCQQR